MYDACEDDSGASYCLTVKLTDKGTSVAPLQFFFTLHFCPFLNIPDPSKRKNPECFYTRTIKAV